ncbi:hypothetical protein N9846_01025 [Akkermansiaceae bacterium]|nr:hypothetical protein [Akkermansiaceae bacterium]
MNRIFLLILCLPISFGLTACSSNVSSEVDTGEVKATAAAETGGEYSLNQKNPFEWSADDVERGQNGNFEGGKRSQYDGKSSSAYGKSREAPGYLSRKYHSAAWNGNKDYSTGSYSSGSKKISQGKKSWFGWNKSRDSNKVARSSGQNFNTGSYTTGAARESGNVTASPSSGYANDRQRIGAKPMIIYSQQTYRQMSVDQSRGLLGKP